MLSTVNDVMIGKIISPVSDKLKTDTQKAFPYTDAQWPVGGIVMVDQQNNLISSKLWNSKDSVSSDVDTVYETATRIDPARNQAAYSGQCFRFVQRIATTGDRGFYVRQQDGSTVLACKGKFRYSDLFDVSRNIKNAADITKSRIEANRVLQWRSVNTVGVDDTKPLKSFSRSVSSPCKMWLVPPAELVSGGTYKLEILYKNVRDLSPNFFSKPYIVNGPTFDSQTPIKDGKDVLEALAAQVNADKFSKVKASYVAVDVDKVPASLCLEAKDPEYSLGQRYEFSPIYFDASLSVYLPGNILGTGGVAIKRWDNGESGNLKTTKKDAILGSGDWRVVSDIEKRQLAHQGITNWVHFPVQLPTMFTKSGMQYDSISFDYAEPYNAADNTIGRKARQSFQLFFEAPSTTDDLKNFEKRYVDEGTRIFISSLSMIMFGRWFDPGDRTKTATKNLLPNPSYFNENL